MKWILGFSLLINVLCLVAASFALHRFGGLKNLRAKINNRGTDHQYQHRKNLFELLPNDSATIVFLGNSITAGNEWAEMLGNPNVVNRGLPGDHCDGVRERLDAIARLKPRKIFLEIGVNDLMYHPPKVVFEKYEKLVQAILEKMPATDLFLQSVLPVNPPVSRLSVRNADILLLNADIQNLAKTKGLIFIDLHPLLRDPEGNLDARYTLDGIHLNGQAYLKWAEAIRPFLVEKVQ